MQIRVLGKTKCNKKMLGYIAAMSEQFDRIHRTRVGTGFIFTRNFSPKFFPECHDAGDLIMFSTTKTNL